MRGLTSKLQRRLRLILACVLLSLAVAPPLVGAAITPAVAALVSAVDIGAHPRVSANVAGPSACERTARAISAQRRAPVHRNEARAALVGEHALHDSSRRAAFDGRRLYLRHLALLC